MDAVKCEAFLTAVDRGSFTAAAEIDIRYREAGILRKAVNVGKLIRKMQKYQIFY